MAATLRENLTSTGQIVNSIKALAEANGWTIDRHDVSSRLHLHKGANHFEVFVYDGQRIGMVACTGYAAGSSASTQPGTSNYNPWGTGVGWVIGSNLANDGGVPKVRYVCTGNTIYCFFGYCQSSGYGMNTRAMAFGEITDKIGNWTGGQFVSDQYASTNGYSFDMWLFGSADSEMNLQVFVNGAWTDQSTHPTVGKAVGFYDTCGALRSKMPNVYNAGILPVPLPLFVRNKSNSSFLHPIGYAPGLRTIAGGDIYVDGDTITIGSDTYIMVQAQQGAVNEYATYAVKLG